MHSAVASRNRRFAIIALGALAFAFAYLVQNAGDNERAHYALVRALADGTPAIDESLRHSALRTVDVTRFEGSAYAAKPPGLAGASVPSYLALEAAGAETTGDPDRIVWALHLPSIVLPAVALLVLVRWFADRIEPGYGTITAVTLGGATLVLPFATLFFSHVLSAALGFFAFALAHRERETAPRPWLAAAAGLAAGLAVTVEYSLGLVALVLTAAFAVGAPRLLRATAYGAGVLAGVAPILAFNAWAFGSPFRLSYEGWHEAGAEPLPGLFGITFPRFDVLLQIFFYPGGVAPIAVPAIVGAVVLWRRRDRWLAVVPMLVGALFLFYVSAHVAPFGGASLGPRYLIPALPFLALPVAAAWRTVPGLTAGLAVGAGVYMAAATLTSPLGAWDHQVLHRLTTGGYVDAVPAFFGLHGGFPAIPFAVALALAAVAALAVTPRPRVLPREVTAGAVACLGWAVLATQTPRLLTHGIRGEVVVVLLACLTAGLVVAAYRTSLAIGLPPVLRSQSTGRRQ